ncbi:P-loop containing nucleoside triphosphate hydrolase protein [Coniella lustricola]|uniref:RNA helicase n=1 Tax=Coniella lustricola TaxID=2025994 RepID=A0A2T3AE14_9PEZI|nr:P-loop containing nucleoside triphosphate hydrolase protein [Coniella lustricola]
MGSQDGTERAATASGEVEVGSTTPAAIGAGEQWAGHEKTKYNYDELIAGQGDYESNARTYAWDGEEGDIGPEYPELELEIFGAPDERGSDDPLGRLIIPNSLVQIKLEQEGPVRIIPIMSFEAAGLHPAMAKNVELCGYKVPTPIQKYCIPAINDGHDVIGIAQTGSGKTAAYLIPILNKLMGKAKKLAAPRPNPATYQAGIDPVVRAEPLVCIVVPTRELAIQIFMEARKLCYRSMLRPCVIYGGGPSRVQMEQLALGCDILIASPGRLIDFMDRPHVLSLRRLKYLVIDEADEMLHDDWKEDFDKILGGGDQEEGSMQYLLFSATFPKDLRDLASNHLATEHVRFRVGRAGSTHENIHQQVIAVEHHLKRTAVMDLLNAMPPARTIIFVNHKRVADELDDFLYNAGMPCTSIHSDRTQREREDAMRSFRAGKSPILIATGVSARGIDVRNVVHVINYDLPSADQGGIEEYIHRIGRTGRIGHQGLATSFYTERDEGLAPVLVRTLLETNQKIPEFLNEHVPNDENRNKWESEGDFANAMAAESGWAGGTGDGGDANGDAWGAKRGEDTDNKWSGPADSGGNAWGTAAGVSAGSGWETGATGNAGNGW